MNQSNQYKSAKLRLAGGADRLVHRLHLPPSLWISMALVAFITGCTAPMPSESIPRVPSADEAPQLYRPWIMSEYKIGVGDVVAIKSYYDPNLNQELTVRPDGKITVLLLGDIQAAGRTPEQVLDAIREKYSEMFPQADTVVGMKEMQGRAVYIGGEVTQPSMQAMQGQLTLVQSVLSSGGFLATANFEDVLLIRKQDDGMFSTFRVNVRDMLSNGAPDIYLQNRDIVFVPKTDIALANEFVAQYLGKMMPEWIRFTFGYQFINQNNSATTIVPAR